MNQGKIRVAVCMITYNHEKFIGKAIEGVVMQKTNFPFKLFVTNDNSPDNTDSICKEYANKYSNLIEYECLNENKGGRFNWLHTIKKCQDSGADYIALCDGDDYWIDSNKLQIQADFLDKNSDFGLIHTEYNVLNNKTGQITYNKHITDGNLIPEVLTTDSLLIHNPISTLTTMFKNDLDDLFSEKIFPNYKTYKFGDYPIWIIFSRKYKVGYINKPTAMYRVLELSASMHGNDNEKRYNFLFSVLKMKYDYIDNFGCQDDTRKVIDQQYNDVKFRYSIYKKDYNTAKEYYHRKNDKNIKQRIKLWSIKNTFNTKVGNTLLKMVNKIKS